MQQPLFTPNAIWSPPVVSSLPSWADAKRVAIDVETYDPDLKKLGPGVRRSGYIAGVSFAIEDGPAFYLPVRHLEDNLDHESVFRYLKEQAAIYKGDICGANLQYDLDYLAQAGVVFEHASFFRDCQIADPLINELYESYSLEAIAGRWGIPGKDETLLRKAAEAWKVDPKNGISKLPARFVADYAIQDVRLPLVLLRKQERLIEEQDLWEVYDLESKVLPVLVKMRRRGIKIDEKKLQYVEDWSEKQEAENLAEVKRLTNRTIKVGDVWRPEPLARVLEVIGVLVPKTAKTGKPSIKQDMLEGINHPVAKLLERARKVNKLRTTFAKSIRTHMTNGRIHCSFNQLRKTDDGTGADKGARYGRLSCVDPNLQQQPAREDFSSMWRSIYVPDDDKPLWAACDYSQQEPRMLVHFAEMIKCDGAKEAADTYRKNPDTDNHTLLARMIFGYKEDEEPSKTDRFKAKTIFLGLCYSMGGAKLARKLGLPTKWITTRQGKYLEVAGDEAQSILDQFNRQVPFVRQLATICDKRATEKGFIRTLSGRRCRFPLNEGKNGYEFTHKALNRLIQGSSADQTKAAMVAADKAGFKLQLQVHDEIGLSVDSLEQAEELAQVMRECVDLRVPSKVDVEIGSSWGEAK